MDYPLPLFSIYLFLLLLLIYLTGHVILSIANINVTKTHSSVFAKLIAGTITVVTVYSVYKTSFSTINSGFILISIFLWWHNGFPKPSWKIELKIRTELKILLQLYIPAFLILIWNHHFLYYERTVPEIPHPDLNFFANISGYMNATGKESFEMNYLNPASTGNIPYHYFELWVNAFASFLFSIPSTLATLMLLAFPVLLTLVISGCLAIMELFRINNFYKILSLGILSFSGVFLPLYKDIPLYWSEAFQTNLMEQAFGLKISVFYLEIIILSLLIFKHNYFEAIISMLFLAFASVLAFTTFIPAAGLLSTYLYFKKLINQRTFIISITATISSAAFYFLFYKFTAGENQVSQGIAGHLKVFF